MIRLAHLAERYHALSTEIHHGPDFNPACAVCTTYTGIIEKILNEWIKEAIFVESDWDQQPYFEIKDKTKMVILKKSDEPFIVRVAKWFGENFKDTLELASIDTIMFRDCDTNFAYSLIIVPSAT